MMLIENNNLDTTLMYIIYKYKLVSTRKDLQNLLGVGKENFGA